MVGWHGERRRVFEDTILAPMDLHRRFPVARATFTAVMLAVLAAPAQPAGDAERGRALLLQRHETGCILCHVVPGLPLGGAIGPSLVDVAQRLDTDALRARIADARRFNPDTVMPPALSTAGLRKVAKPYAGRSLLTEQALEDIVAYLARPAPAPDAAR